MSDGQEYTYGLDEIDISGNTEILFFVSDETKSFANDEVNINGYLE